MTSESPILSPDLFHSPLETDPVTLDDGEVGLDLRTVSGYWLYEACLGNPQAERLALGLMQVGNPVIHSGALLSRCRQGEEAAIQQAIALMHEGLTHHFDQAFAQHPLPPPSSP